MPAVAAGGSWAVGGWPLGHWVGGAWEGQRQAGGQAGGRHLARAPLCFLLLPATPSLHCPAPPSPPTHPESSRRRPCLSLTHHSLMHSCTHPLHPPTHLQPPPWRTASRSGASAGSRCTSEQYSGTASAVQQCSVQCAGVSGCQVGWRMPADWPLPTLLFLTLSSPQCICPSPPQDPARPLLPAQLAAAPAQPAGRGEAEGNHQEPAQVQQAVRGGGRGAAGTGELKGAAGVETQTPKEANPKLRARGGMGGCACGVRVVQCSVYEFPMSLAG